MAVNATEDSEHEPIDALDIEDDEGWDDVEPDIEKVKFVSLFDNEVFDNVPSMLLHCKTNYNFDFVETQKKLSKCESIWGPFRYLDTL